MSRRPIAACVAVTLLAAASALPAPARAADFQDGWKWLEKTNEIQTEGAIWNDRIGDGKDRWKTGGMTQSYVFPQHIFSDSPWFPGTAAALELNVRGLLMTPDDTSTNKVNLKDRPYAQYAAAGLYLRTISHPQMIHASFGMQQEDKVGFEVGWQGEPLPLYEVQKAVHDMTGSGGTPGNMSDIIQSELMVNLEGRHTWRYHWDGARRDTEIAPFVQGSLGMRETSVRVGADLILGSALEGRTWGNDLATGALLSGASMPRKGFSWAVFAGADLGYVAHDAFLDGGFAVNGPSVPREKLVPRARVGVLLDYDHVGIGFSMNWLGKEFKAQKSGQVIGALQLKLRL